MWYPQNRKRSAPRFPEPEKVRSPVPSRPGDKRSQEEEKPLRLGQLETIPGEECGFPGSGIHAGGEADSRGEGVAGAEGVARAEGVAGAEGVTAARMGGEEVSQCFEQGAQTMLLGEFARVSRGPAVLGSCKARGSRKQPRKEQSIS
jgi:hypothetical protein